ncbi:MAG: dTDP-4-dehydrorhamnose reductase [bacterium]|nr:dTDP-4-dehydrorhamnose reductase [bacterium]
MMLVTGGSGQLGTSFRRLLPDAVFPSRHELDLSAPDNIRSTLEEIEPTAIINCAAFTAVDRAEDDEATATVVNGVAVGLLAEYAAERRIPLVTFSTDYVFDGAGTQPYMESDPVDPINAYGRSKRVGEELALSYADALVIRTSWVISGTHPNFVATMMRLAATNDSLKVIDDQRGCPTITDDLAAATLRALDAGATGLLHLTNQGVTTWYQLARRAIELAGLDVSKVSPCATDEYPLPAPRPSYSVLGSERIDALGVAPLPEWEVSLPAVVEVLSRL